MASSERSAAEKPRMQGLHPSRIYSVSQGKTEKENRTPTEPTGRQEAGEVGLQLPGRMHNLLDQFASQKYNIVATFENRTEGPSVRNAGDWIVISGGYTKNSTGASILGCGACIRRNWKLDNGDEQPIDHKRHVVVVLSDPRRLVFTIRAPSIAIDCF